MNKQDFGSPSQNSAATEEAPAAAPPRESDQMEAQSVLAAIVESSEDAILSKTLDGVITSWNAAATRLFGYEREEIVGKSVLLLVPPELHEEEMAILNKLRAGIRIAHQETQRLTNSGERVDVAVTISPVRDRAGRIVGASNITRDISTQKRAEQQLRIAEKLAATGRMAATIAHEINNPLEAITNLLYLARRQAIREDVQQYLDLAQEELARVSHLTKETLGFYRNTNEAGLTRIGPMVAPTMALFASRARNKSIEIRSEIRDHPEILAAPGELRQLVANLLGNSIDALQNRGLIRIRVAAGAERNGRLRAGVRVTVADTGPGIPPHMQSRVFEPFFTTKKEVGTGLGLWVCKNIVEKYGGHIRVKSSAGPGKSWTAFSIFLPAAAPTAK